LTVVVNLLAAPSQGQNMIARQIKPAKRRASTVLMLGILGCFLVATELPAEEFHQSFREGMPDPSMLTLVGPNAQKTVKQGPEGLRINMQPGRKASAPVGLTTKFGLRGNFEIIVTYELLKVETTESGFGAGINLWIGTASARADEASLGRFSRKNESVHLVTKSAKDKQGKVITSSFTYPTNAAKGRLRLDREGGTLRCSVSEGTSSEFVAVHTSAEFVRDDVRSIRIAGNTGSQPLALDFRITEISIRGDQLIDPEAAVALASWWTWGVANAIGLVLLVAIALWLFRRGRRSPAPVAAAPTNLPSSDSPPPHA
jgi:hypothetical protein